MPADTKPDPTQDRPFQYSLRTLLFIMTGLCVCLGLMQWNLVIGILSMSAGSLVIAVRMSRLERLISVIVAVAIVVNGCLFLPNFAAGLTMFGLQDCLVRNIWFLSGALVASINIVALIVALREHVRWLNVIAFVANGYLLCLCLTIRFLLRDWNSALPTTTVFFMIPLNVLALLLANEYWREDSPLSRQSRGSRKSFSQSDIRPAKK